MTIRVNRRAALGLGTVATAGTVLGAGTPASAAAMRPRAAANAVEAASWVAARYAQQSTLAGGNWQAYVTVANSSAAPLVAVADEADTQIEAYSVNKIAVATAVLDKVDRGLLTLAQQVDVTASIVVPGGDGIFSLDGAYPSSVTLGHALANLLTVSDDTAVRLCGLVCPAAELNQILVAKGFPNTQVQPVANPNRFFLGTSTPGSRTTCCGRWSPARCCRRPRRRSCSGCCAPPSRSMTASGGRCPPRSGPGSPPRRAGSATPGTRPG